MKKRFHITLAVALLLSIVFASTAYAVPEWTNYNWSFNLTNPSSGVSGSVDCQVLREAGSSKSNKWKIKINGFNGASQGGGVFVNCYEWEARFVDNRDVVAGKGFYVTDTQLHKGSWKADYIIQKIVYTPVGRLATDEASSNRVWGQFNCQS